MFVAYHRVKKMKIQRYYARRTHDAQIIIRRNLYDGMRRKEKERKVQEEKEVSKEE